LTQEIVAKPISAELNVQEAKRVDKRQIGIQEIVESLKGAADDIGQISELSTEEKLIVAQFFNSLLKLMKPLSSAIPVSTSALPIEIGNLSQAHIDPTGRLALSFEDGHFELKDLNEDRNRDLMIAVVGDVMPKFRGLTSAAKRRIENRIKFLSTVTKEMQKSSDALSAVMSGSE
jgi:hypothetical protein